MTEKIAQYQLVYGDAAKMGILRSGEADLVLTGPPYFSKETETLLEKPTAEQDNLERVRREITAFAMSLRPVYDEIARVLKTEGVLVIQIKDIRYQRVLISLTDLHRQMIEALGFNLVTRVYWHKKRKRSSAIRFRDNPFVGSFIADDVEDVLVFSRSPIQWHRKGRVNLSDDEIEKCWRSPLWDVTPVGRRRRHPHQSPEKLFQRIIALYSVPGDLVVDPFVGGGDPFESCDKHGKKGDWL